MSHQSKPIYETIEWTDLWISSTDQIGPRVLFVGDSITRAYFGPAERALLDETGGGGPPWLSSRFTTSLSVCHPVFWTQLRSQLTAFPVDLVHFNHGLHGWDYTEDEYLAGYREVVDKITSEFSAVRVVLALTTPYRVAGDLLQFAPRNERVVERNRLVVNLAKELGLPVNDLYTWLLPHAEWWGQDGVHLNENGNAALGALAAQAVRKFG